MTGHDRPEYPSTAEKILNVRLPVELHGQLEQLVQATGRSKSFLTVEALKSYLISNELQPAHECGLPVQTSGTYRSISGRWSDGAWLKFIANQEKLCQSGAMADRGYIGRPTGG